MNILVTGGASGLGRAITEALSSTNHRVYFTYSKSHDAAADITSRFPNATGIQCDFTDQSDINSLCERLPDLQLHGLVHNAYIGPIVKNHFHKLDIQAFENEFEWNIKPVIFLTQKALTTFRKQKFGKIVSILSAALVNTPPSGWSAYVASKNYLWALSKSWAKENASFNVTANTVSPDFMETALTADTDSRIVDELKSVHPLKKLLEPAEVAQAVVYLMQSSQQVNGINLVMNSGKNVV